MPDTNSEKIKRLEELIIEIDDNVLDSHRKQINKLRFWLRVCMYGWFITLLSGAAILYTGKIPPIEMPFKRPTFGSEYPNEFWYKNDGK